MQILRKKLQIQLQSYETFEILQDKEQDDATAETYALVDKLNQQIEVQRTQIESQQTQIDKFSSKNRINITGNSNSNNTNNVQININVDKNRLNYKDTNYSILTDQNIQYAINHAGRCLQEIISLTHFDPGHPENQNIYIFCLKSAVAMMFEDERWNAHAWNDIADRVIDDNTVTLQEWIDIHKNQHPRLAEKFRRFMENKEGEDDKFSIKLKRELKMVLYNNRKIIHSSEMVKILQSLDEDIDESNNVTDSSSSEQ